jgi:hypothetical protein
MYGKVAFIVLFFFQKYTRLGVYYTLVCFILWLALAHPKYNGPSKMSKLKDLTQLTEMTGLSADELLRHA